MPGRMSDVGSASRCRWPLPLLAALVCGVVGCAQASAAPPERGYRSPVDLAVSADGHWLVSANDAAATASLVRLDDGSVVDEIDVGLRPIAVASRGRSGFVVTTLTGGDVVAVDVAEGRLREAGRLHLGFEPRGLAVSPDGHTGYVTLAAIGRLVVVDLASMRSLATVDVGRLPGGITVSADGGTVAVACTSPTEIVLVDAKSWEICSRHPFKGLNLGHLAFTSAGERLYFSFTYDGGSHPAPGNIRRGWVTGSRLGVLDVAAGTLAGLTLDVSGRAVGDVRGVAVTADGRDVLVTAGGTHELLRFDASRLPWKQISGSEVMDAALARDPERFRRLDLEGRPLGIRVAADGRAFVANALRDAVQEIDVNDWSVVRTIPVDRGHDPSSEARLVRRGEEIFHDARRSLDQWYSCHTCHFEGGGNTVTFDTLNDGSVGSYKTVLPLWGVARTGPWTWHGWQEDLDTSLRKSLVDSMQGPAPTAEDVEALAAYLATLEPPPSPFREADGGLSPAAERGRLLFASARAGCTACHAGPDFTSGENHDVGLGRRSDRYQGFSPPTLRGLFRKTMYLHSGRSKLLTDLLTGVHGPDAVSGLPPLSSQEAEDLAAYLRSL
jgi:DNA-binding beta-propeller fold protein YncE